ncbi:MAG: hypothetical protein AB8B70_06200 [Prochlorococcus sp.]
MRSIETNQMVLTTKATPTPVGIPNLTMARGTSSGNAIAPAIGVIATNLRMKVLFFSNV